MTAPIRSMAELVEGTRSAQLEREISYQEIEHIGGLSSGTVAKYLGPNPSKRMGLLSTFLILQSLGKGLQIVDDPEQIARVQKRWQRRIIKGGATLQMRARAAQASSLASVAGMADEQRKIEISNRMKELRSKVKKESLRNSGKRRMKLMKKRARQAMASHAARKRWAGRAETSS